MKHVFILNAFAGKKSSVEDLKQQIAELDIADECIVKVTQSAGDAKRIANEIVSSTDEFVRIYACGGDGTANEAMSGMVGYKNCALGVIPVGTGNDFVKSFKCGLKGFLNLKEMVKADTVVIDLLECCGNYALNSISVGYDCAVAKQAQKIKRFPLLTGPGAYKLALVYCLFSKRRHKFDTYADEEKINLPKGFKTQMMCIAGNGKYYGGGFKATPYAEFSDGNIDVVAVPTVSLVKFARLVGPFSKGEHIGHKNAPFIIHKKCKQLAFKHDKKIDIGLDGEIYNLKDPVITVKPACLNIIVPNG